MYCFLNLGMSGRGRVWKDLPGFNSHCPLFAGRSTCGGLGSTSGSTKICPAEGRRTGGGTRGVRRWAGSCDFFHCPPSFASHPCQALGCPHSIFSPLTGSKLLLPFLLPISPRPPIKVGVMLEKRRGRGRTRKLSTRARAPGSRALGPRAPVLSSQRWLTILALNSGNHQLSSGF